MVVVVVVDTTTPRRALPAQLSDAPDERIFHRATALRGFLFGWCVLRVYFVLRVHRGNACANIG